MPTLLETLASYVPAMIARRLVADPTPPTQSTAEQFPAAALFADISGFTALAERLAQRGAEGAETLSQILNAYFGQLINIVQAHGGDIVKFAGDALLAVWPTPDEISVPLAQLSPIVRASLLRAVSLRAAQCALAIQAQLNDYPALEDVRLSMKIGIGAGELLVAHVGGIYGRWELLVAGEPLKQMSLAEQRAQPGNVIVSEQAWALVRDYCVGIEATAQFMRITAMHTPLTLRATVAPHLSAHADDHSEARLPVIAAESSAQQLDVALRAYIPGVILSRLAAGQTGWLAELRRVTILFIHLPLDDMDSTHPAPRMHQIMCALQIALYRYEGSVNKLSVDEKGVMLLAAFGLPPLAHENDPIRAIQAAMAAQQAMRELGLSCAIGVTTGRAFCGLIGNDVRREYTMLGDVVNLAARLMQAAMHAPKRAQHLPPSVYGEPSEPAWQTAIDSLGNMVAAAQLTATETQRSLILCDETTYQSAQFHFTFDVLPPIQVKGKAEPVAVYLPSNQRQIATRSNTSIVGRAQERMVISDFLQETLRGKEHAVIVIEGEAGIGKSRLIEESCRQAEATELTLLIGAGDAIEQSTPYHAWRPIFHRWLGTDAIAENPARREHVLSLLKHAPDLTRLAPLLNDALGIDWPDNEITAQMTGQVRADNTLALLIELLQLSLNAMPKLIVLEDAHWLDSASWHLMLAVHQQVRHTLLIVSTRPFTSLAATAQTTPTEYTQLLRSPHTHHLRLESLSANETISLVCQRLGVATLPVAVNELIIQRAEGNPFFAEELAYALRDNGLIVISDGECQVAEHIGRDVAQSLREMNFPDTVQGVVTSRIDRLTPEQQLTLKVASVIGRIFSLRTLRDVYPIESDKALLAQQLDALAQLELTPLETPDPQRTHIFKHIISQEVAYNLMLFAQRRELHRAVAQWHEQHIADLEPHYTLLAYHWRKAEHNVKTMEYLEKAGEKALRGGAYQEAVSLFSELLTLASEITLDSEAEEEESDEAASDQQKPNADTQLRRARWERQLGVAHFGLGKLNESRTHLNQAISLLDRPIPQQQAQLVWGLLGQVTRQTGHRLTPGRLIQRISTERERFLEAARAYVPLSEVIVLGNDLMPGVYAIFRTLNIAERSGSSPELARAYANMCIACGLIPVHRLAEAYGQRARETAQRESHQPTQAHVLQRTGIYLSGVGQWARVRAQAEEGIAICERLGDWSMRGEHLTLLALIHYFQGEFNRSRQFYAEVHDNAQKHGQVQQQAWGLYGQGMNLMRLGQTDDAINMLERARALLTTNADRLSDIISYGVLASAHLQRKQWAAAQQAAINVKHLIGYLPTVYATLEGYSGFTEVAIKLWKMTAQGQELLPGIAKIEHPRHALWSLHNYARVFPIGKPRAWLWQGVHDSLLGKPVSALRAWRKSLTAAQKLQMPYEAALAHREIGRSPQVKPDEQASHLAEASDIFVRLGVKG